MSDLLQTIQNTVAKEWYDKTQPNLSEKYKKWDGLQYIDMNKLWPEVCKRYAAAEYNKAIEDIGIVFNPVFKIEPKAENVVLIMETFKKAFQEMQKIKK